jgi:hypothetical protein
MAESYTGEVRNGVVVFDPGAAPPSDGTRVRIEVAAAEARDELSEILLEFAGKAKGLPADLAAQHDRDIRGTPER